MQTHKPPTLFRLFLSLLDLQTALPLLRTETAAPPTVATPLTVTKVTRVASDDDSASEIARIHAFRLCPLLRSQTDVRSDVICHAYLKAAASGKYKCVTWISLSLSLSKRRILNLEF